MSVVSGNVNVLEGCFLTSTLCTESKFNVIVACEVSSRVLNWSGCRQVALEGVEVWGLPWEITRLGK